MTKTDKKVIISALWQTRLSHILITTLLIFHIL